MGFGPRAPRARRNRGAGVPGPSAPGARRKEFLTCEQASQSKEAKAGYDDDDDDHDDDADAMPAMCCFVLFCVVLFSELAMTIKMSLTVCGSLLCDGDGDALERR